MAAELGVGEAKTKALMNRYKPTYSDVFAAFYLDGSYRDICVLDTSIADWNAVLAALAPMQVTYTIDTDSAEPPEDAVSAVFDRDRQHVLVVDLGCDVIAKTHFFWDDEIEFDIDPQDVTDQACLDCVLGFMRLLGSATNKDVLLTAENRRDAVWLRWSGDHWAYTPWDPDGREADPGLPESRE